MILLILHNILIPATIIGIVLSIMGLVGFVEKWEQGDHPIFKRSVMIFVSGIALELLVWGAPKPDYNIQYKDRIVVHEPAAGQLYSDCVQSHLDQINYTDKDRERMETGCIATTRQHLQLLTDFAPKEQTK
jgi:hypothetical protein